MREEHEYRAYDIFNARKAVVWFAEDSEDYERFRRAAELFAVYGKVIEASKLTSTLLKKLKLNTEAGRLKATRRLATVAISHLLYDDDPQEIVIVVHPVGEGEWESHIRLARKMVIEEGLAFIDWMDK